MSRYKDQFRPSSQLTAPLNPDIIVRASETATRQPSAEVDLGTMKIGLRAAQGGRAVEVIHMRGDKSSLEGIRPFIIIPDYGDPREADRPRALVFCKNERRWQRGHRCQNQDQNVSG